MKTIHSLTLFMALLLLLVACQNNSQPKKSKADDRVQIEMQISQGAMIIALYNETTKHRDNFIKLAEEGALVSQKEF